MATKADNEQGFGVLEKNNLIEWEGEILIVVDLFLFKM